MVSSFTEKVQVDIRFLDDSGHGRVFDVFPLGARFFEKKTEARDAFAVSWISVSGRPPAIHMNTAWV